MHRNRRLAAMVLATAVPLGLVAGLAVSGGAFAATAKATALKGTISCTNTGTSSLTFKPALAATGTAKPDVTKIGTLTLSGCTVSPSIPGAPTGGTATVSPIKAKSDLCSAFVSNAASTKLKLSIKWTGGSAPAASTVFFRGATVSSSPPGFAFSGGKVTGAFATSNTAHATVLANTAETVNLLNCGSNGTPSAVSSLGITGGSGSF